MAFTPSFSARSKPSVKWLMLGNANFPPRVAGTLCAMAAPSVAAPHTRSWGVTRRGARRAISRMAASYCRMGESASNPSTPSSDTAQWRMASSPYFPFRDSSANCRVASHRRTGLPCAQTL